MLSFAFRMLQSSYKTNTVPHCRKPITNNHQQNITQITTTIAIAAFAFAIATAFAFTITFAIAFAFAFAFMTAFASAFASAIAIATAIIKPTKTKNPAPPKMPPNNAPTISNHNPNEEAPGAPGPPPGIIPFQIPTLPQSPLERQIAAFLIGELAEAMDTPLVPGFESFDFGINGPRSDHGSQSSTSDAGSDTDTDTGSELLCTICSRRQKRVRYVACGHRTCASCTKKLWWSMIRRAGRARDPWPASIPCPFCRAAVTAVVDEEEGEGEDVVGGVCAAVSGLVTGGGADGGATTTSGIAADDGSAGGLDVAGGGEKGEGVLIVDWMLVRSKHALWRLRLETAERVVVAGGGGGAADGGEGRAWGGGEMPDWNEFFFD
ncbi:hypothetical protein DFP73DRAFT_611759 [Morchella snyderi]|nr:hypothetical protein DFP73DRAFT_611759 [Morchella snyderi]